MVNEIRRDGEKKHGEEKIRRDELTKSQRDKRTTKTRRDKGKNRRREEGKKGKIYEIRRREKMGNEKKTRGRQEGNKTKRER